MARRASHASHLLLNYALGIRKNFLLEFTVSSAPSGLRMKDSWPFFILQEKKSFLESDVDQRLIRTVIRPIKNIPLSTLVSSAPSGLRLKDSWPFLLDKISEKREKTVFFCYSELPQKLNIDNMHINRCVFLSRIIILSFTFEAEPRYSYHSYKLNIDNMHINRRVFLLCILNQ